MPKGKVVIGGGSRKMKNIRRKFKLGGRSSTLSALSLSTNDLLDRLYTTSNGRDKRTMIQVLHQRGIVDINGAIATMLFTRA